MMGSGLSTLLNNNGVGQFWVSRLLLIKSLSNKFQMLFQSCFNFLLLLVYPFEASDRRIVEKDRRGELFYYMHQQVKLMIVLILLDTVFIHAHHFRSLPVTMPKDLVIAWHV